MKQITQVVTVSTVSMPLKSITHDNMAKLYAEITSDKGGRVVGKGGDQVIHITLKKGNYKTYHIAFDDDGIFVRDTITGEDLVNIGQ